MDVKAMCVSYNLNVKGDKYLFDFLEIIFEGT